MLSNLVFGGMGSFDWVLDDRKGGTIQVEKGCKILWSQPQASRLSTGQQGMTVEEEDAKLEQRARNNGSRTWSQATPA